MDNKIAKENQIAEVAKSIASMVDEFLEERGVRIPTSDVQMMVSGAVKPKDIFSTERRIYGSDYEELTRSIRSILSLVEEEDVPTEFAPQLSLRREDIQINCGRATGYDCEGVMCTQGKLNITPGLEAFAKEVIRQRKVTPVGKLSDRELKTFFSDDAELIIQSCNFRIPDYFIDRDFSKLPKYSNMLSFLVSVPDSFGGIILHYLPSREEGEMIWDVYVKDSWKWVPGRGKRTLEAA